jgi:large conductance mechanosensitive channel
MYFGAVIGAIINFLLVAIVVYFALIVPINYLKRVSFRRRDEESPGDAPPTELQLLAEIRDLLKERPGSEAEPGERD